MRWSPPEQKAQPPSRGDGPLPVRSTQPTSDDCRAWSRARYSSSTVWGRKALRTSGRSNAMRTVPWSAARWYVMSVKSKPGTSVQRAGSKISETPFGAVLGIRPSLPYRAAMPTLQLFGVEGLPEIEPGADLAAMIFERVELADGDIVVVTSKIVSKAEGAIVELDGVTPSEFAVSFAERWDKDPRVVEVVLRQ